MLTDFESLQKLRKSKKLNLTALQKEWPIKEADSELKTWGYDPAGLLGSMIGWMKEKMCWCGKEGEWIRCSAATWELVCIIVFNICELIDAGGHSWEEHSEYGEWWTSGVIWRTIRNCVQNEVGRDRGMTFSDEMYESVETVKWAVFVHNSKAETSARLRGVKYLDLRRFMGKGLNERGLNTCTSIQWNVRVCAGHPIKWLNSIRVIITSWNRK